MKTSCHEPDARRDDQHVETARRIAVVHRGVDAVERRAEADWNEHRLDHHIAAEPRLGARRFDAFAVRIAKGDPCLQARGGDRTDEHRDDRSCGEDRGADPQHVEEYQIAAPCLGQLARNHLGISHFRDARDQPRQDGGARHDEVLAVLRVLHDVRRQGIADDDAHAEARIDQARHPEQPLLRR